MIFGAGNYRYELVTGWAKLPAGWSLPDVCSISVDAHGRVYALTRSDHPMVIFDRSGNLVAAWGENFFKRAHGSCLGQDGSLFCADDGQHTVTKFTVSGKLLLQLGNKDQPSDTGYRQSADILASLSTITRVGGPFNCPTGVALNKSGEIYVSDGYGNARVHRFSPEGKLLYSWGEPGTGPGQFRVPHNVWIDGRERVWIPDRENGRLQVFDARGKYLFEWSGLMRPTAVFIDDDEVVYVSELGVRVSIFGPDGKILARWSGEGQSKETDTLVSPHAIAVDSQGDIYIGEVARSAARVERGQKTLLKFARKQ
jgi:DNA-binding beta-propeller fold protein YncE